MKDTGSRIVFGSIRNENFPQRLFRFFDRKQS